MALDENSDKKLITTSFYLNIGSLAFSFIAGFLAILLLDLVIGVNFIVSSRSAVFHAKSASRRTICCSSSASLKTPVFGVCEIFAHLPRHQSCNYSALPRLMGVPLNCRLVEEGRVANKE